MKQSNKDLSIVFFNSVEDMNECYGIDAKLPTYLHNNTDLLCYEIVETFVCEYLGQYVFTKVGFHHLDDLCSPVINNHNEITLESEVYEDDIFEHEERCFVYVRVNEYLRKHLEKTLIGCEFMHYTSKSEPQFRRFVHSVEVIKLGAIATDQNGFISVIDHILLYPDDYSDHIHYKEWVKQINEQDVEVED